ncbi:unnamed protein product [Bursaphelenchus xylophilus]|uniref:(pine wood nematode) hypothetical protein n=1 Tax=Bursaphelenchus xylophilus TaxID=6326 RepID=A0A1I7RU83_BURXY|nr:unnamed protein product [Bursaphelenchus xylophilus]CAG9113915.1 unnamed protein product [Bursaphelenchus xylophilus]
MMVKPQILICFTIFVIADAVEETVLEKKAKYMENLMDTSVKPCENFWSFANQHYDFAKLPYRYLQVLGEVFNSTRKDEINSIKKIRNHFAECRSKGLASFTRDLNTATQRDKPWEKDMNLLERRFQNSSLSDNATYMEMMTEMLRLQHKYSLDGAMESLTRLAQANIVFPPVYREAVNSKVENTTVAKTFLARIFDEDVDVSNREPVLLIIPSEVSTRQRIWNLFKEMVSNVSATTIPKYITCETYMSELFPIFVQKMVYDHMGADNAKKVSDLFRADLRDLIRTVEAEFKHGNMLNDETRTVLLDKLRNNTFNLIDHPIFEDSMFEKYFGNLTTEYPLLNQFANNAKPMIRAAKGRGNEFFWTPRLDASHLFYVYGSIRIVLSFLILPVY